MTAEVFVVPMAASDVRDLARLHRAAFPGFFLSTLGEPFLVQFYRAGGWKLTDSYQTSEGRSMQRYTKRLEAR